MESGSLQTVAEPCPATAGVDRQPQRRTVRVAAEALADDWVARLERRVHEITHPLRDRLAGDLADLHRRCAGEIGSGIGCAGLPEVLDREVQALSSRAVAECAGAVAQILDAGLTHVLGKAPEEDVRQRTAAAVRRGFVDDPAARDLDRVLLVTTTGGVATVTGSGALAALAAHTEPAGREAILPPFGIGLSGGCFRHWRNPANDDARRARAWLQRVVSSLDQELIQEVTRRLAAVRRSLATVLGDAIDHGILLA